MPFVVTEVAETTMTRLTNLLKNIAAAARFGLTGHDLEQRVIWKILRPSRNVPFWIE